MTIKELTSLFTIETEITIVSSDNDNMVSVCLTHLLLGYPAFTEMPLMIQSVQAVGKNMVVAEIDMPVEILRAWKKYSDDYYKAV